MRAIIDRFEGKYAVCEISIGKFALIQRSILPLDAREGSALDFVMGHWIVNQARSNARKSRIKALMSELFV